jgi:NAD(P)-dependent dehydrogenase (short-subunit alcohol dehydrogenase family)
MAKVYQSAMIESVRMGSMVENLPLSGKAVLVTGAVRRIGRALALAAARAGADVVLHFAHDPDAAASAQREIEALGRRAWSLRADFTEPGQAEMLIDRAADLTPIFGLVNSAAVFQPLSMGETRPSDWERHFLVNLTAPFLLVQGFARRIGPDTNGRIVNILDWRALRPGADHFAYTVSKAALAAMTRALAVALAPRITVNGLALGAILPPAGQAASRVVDHVPLQRWGNLQDVEETLLFLLAGPAYVTGEIIHVDGGRHLV